MRTRRFLLALLLFPLCVVSAGAAGKKEQKLSISFHLQGDVTDNPKMIQSQMVGGKQLYFRRVPEIATKDIVSFAPFPADDGQYGLVLRLKDSASNRVSAITTAHQGKWLLAQVNGRVCDAVIIDKPVNDARLVIWKRVTTDDIALLDKEFPRIGREKEKKKKSWFSSSN